MSRFPQGHQPPIGATLTAAREEHGLDIAAMEERTKIRGRYLRALEAENWEALPTLSYAKGFLRAYAGELGLDAEALIDQFRREVESAVPAAERPYPLGDQVLEHRRRGVRRRPALLAPLAIVALLALVALGALAARSLLDDEEARDGRERTGRQAAGGQNDARAGGGGGGGRDEPRGPSGGSFRLQIEALNEVELCLVSGGRALIDAQALRRGAEAGPYTGRHFRLDLISGGTVRLARDGRMRRVSSVEPARYVVGERSLRPLPYDGGGRCP